MSEPIADSGEKMDISEENIDESLYSRQLYVMGFEAQRKMAASDVLLVGLNGTGVEVAKNVILAGVRSVTLLDDAPVTSVDLSSQFYCGDGDIGRSRAAVSAPRLAELNPYVPVSVATGPLTTGLVAAFRVVVLIGVAAPVQREIADFCHDNSICVILSDVYGVFGNVFCDFGESFAVADVDGEPAASCLVASITRDSPALVCALEESRHHLCTGDVVEISGLTGMEELNGRQFAVTVKDLNSFEIDVDTSVLTPYRVGGYVKQIKQPKSISFRKYSESAVDPGDIVCDFTKFDRAGPLHIAFRALKEFAAQSCDVCLPRPGNLADAEKVFMLASQLNRAAGEAQAFHVEDLSAHRDMILRLALCSRGMISPMCALMGGVVAQEVLKAASGKFMPIKQWMYYDAMEALPSEILPEDEVTPGPTPSRYDGQVMVFGKAMQKALAGQSMFLVGAGAIGCEMLKNWAMMGVACAVDGAEKCGIVHVTDMDHIEKSNLSRQFLFRNADINQPKSRTAAVAASNMNSNLNYSVYETKVAPETENLFNDDFYESLSFVCTALDNVEARLYVDQKCVFYRLPMLESGTLGTKGHTQVVVPGLTENYGASRDPPEKSIPLCTLKHFPNLIEHTIQWAREWFEESFRQTAEDCNNCLTSNSSEEYFTTLSSQQNMMLETLQRVKAAAVTAKPRCFEDCVSWARICFEDLFSHKIQQLLHNYPLDRVTESGTPFWSGAKKPPTALFFDATDPLHLEFVAATSLMRCRMYGIEPPVGVANNQVAEIASKVDIPSFRPQEGVKYTIVEDELNKGSDDNEGEPPAKRAMTESASSGNFDTECRNLVTELTSVVGSSETGVLMPIDFDKDVDEHMRVIASCANLRARNYKIPEADFHTARGIAGKITPAISTTTAFVAGSICMEIYKIIQGKGLNEHVNSFTNLAIPMFASMTPEPPKTVTSIIKSKEWKWTMWDCIDVHEPSMTLSGLMQFLTTEFGLELSMLSSGVSILFSDFMNRKKLEERRNMPIKQIAELISKKEFHDAQRYAIFEVIATDLDSGDEVELPYLRFRLS